MSHLSVLQEQRGSAVCPLDPVELLRECEEALRDRPARFHRKFINLNDGDSAPSSPIRVMQWNILAQGICLYHMTLDCRFDIWNDRYELKIGCDFECDRSSELRSTVCQSFLLVI